MFETDWNNVDLNSPCERDLSILDAYSFDTLLLEISCNLPEINQDTVKEQFYQELRNKVESAKAVFEANLQNITPQASKERSDY